MCDIESVEDTEIICLIADSGKVHAVTNLGTHRGTDALVDCFVSLLCGFTSQSRIFQLHWDTASRALTIIMRK